MKPIARRLTPVLAILGVACTSQYQLRGTEKGLGPVTLDEMVGTDEKKKAVQIALEHQSVENFGNFKVGIIEVTDEGFFNPSQKDAVMRMVRERHAVDSTTPGAAGPRPGLLVVFVHGWHHGARVCDRDLACFRRVLALLRADNVTKGGEVTGLFIGWRGESVKQKGVNLATLWGRKRVAWRIGRTAGRELFTELGAIWQSNKDLRMVTVGHSLGGAFVYGAVKSKLTGNISDIERQELRTYRVVRAEESRPEALSTNKKALRARFGDLIVLVNPALEASEYKVFDQDLRDIRPSVPTNRDGLIAERLPYDKHAFYSEKQLPILLTLASRADTAVGRIFPPAMFLRALFGLRWTHFGTIYRSGLGRYAPFVTHELIFPDPDPKKERSPISRDCGCPKKYGAATLPGDLDLTSLEPQRLGQGVLCLMPERLQRGWDPHSPYSVVATSAGVISEHSDIFNPVFVGFLRKYLEAYDKKGVPTRR